MISCGGLSGHSRFNRMEWRERERGELSARNESKEDEGRDVLERMFFAAFCCLLFKRIGFDGEKEGNRKKRNRQKGEKRREGQFISSRHVFHSSYHSQ